MDPLQRQILEVGYAALHNAGFTHKSLLQSLTAIYVASPLSEFQWLDTGPAEAGGCAQRSAGTGVAGSIMSNRFSFVFGMNGPSVTFDTDGSSSLVIMDAGIQALDNVRNQSTQSCLTGVNAVLTPLSWIARMGLGHMSTKGRTFTYDASCDGWIKSDSFASLVMDLLHNRADGQLVEDHRPYLGCTAAVAVAHIGQAASLGTPHGPGVQRIIADACRQGEVQCASVDAMECHGEGLALNDAIELSSLCTVMNVASDRLPLQTSSVKTNLGYGLHGAGLAQMLKVIFSQRQGLMKPLQHLYQVHPQMQDAAENLMIATENLTYYTRSSVHGVISNGWGGTMGCVMCTGALQSHTPQETSRSMMLWLGGGGQAPKPEKGYFITGSWDDWNQGIAMMEEAPGIYVASVQLTRASEEFQIALDSTGARCLKPQEGWTQSGSRAFLHEKALPRGVSWRLLGEEKSNWVVRLVTSGKWQVVAWERRSLREQSLEDRPEVVFNAE